MEHTVTVKGTGTILHVDESTDMLTALKGEGIYVKSGCGGHASCSDCIVKVVSGADNLNAPSFEETQLLGNVFHITKERLACQVKISGPVELDLSAHNKSSDEQKIKSKSGPRPKTKVRQQDDVKKMYQERAQQREEKKQGQDTWQNHWEKDKDPKAPKRLGGGRRPKAFRTDNLDDDGDNKK